MRDKPLKYKPQGKHCSQCANFQRFTDAEAAWVQQYRRCDTAWCNDERCNTINGRRMKGRATVFETEDACKWFDPAEDKFFEVKIWEI